MKFLKTLLVTIVALLPLSASAKVSNIPELQEAVVTLSCRTKITNKNLGGGSATRIYHEAGGPWVLLTAYHVTAGCEDAGGVLTALIIKDLVDKDGNIYHNKEIYSPVQAISNDPQHDVSILETLESFSVVAKTIKLSQEKLEYLQPVLTAGYPGPFRDGVLNSLVMTKGIINSPHAVVRMCRVDDFSEKAPKWAKVLFPSLRNAPDMFDCSGEDESEMILIEIILTDSEIGPGNSGGALLNEHLEQIGITVMGIQMGNSRPGSIPMLYIIPAVQRTKYASKILKSV